MKNRRALSVETLLSAVLISVVALAEGPAAAPKAEAPKAGSKEEKQKIMQDAIDSLKASGMVEKLPKVGDTFPAFELTDAAGKKVKSTQLIGKSKAIVTFYRGGWCPFCVAQLRGFQKELPAIVKKGAVVIAISPEKPENTTGTKTKNELGFNVLSDAEYAFEKKIGVAYELPENLRSVYKEFGLDLPALNGGTSWMLPVAATYVVDKKGKIVYAFVDADYKVRAPMPDVLAALDK